MCYPFRKPYEFYGEKPSDTVAIFSKKDHCGRVSLPLFLALIFSSPIAQVTGKVSTNLTFNRLVSKFRALLEDRFPRICATNSGDFEKSFLSVYFVYLTCALG